MCEDKISAWLAKTSKFTPSPFPVNEDLALQPGRTQAKYREAKYKARECARVLPEPLTTALLSAAYKEVPSGVEKAIDHVIDCWRMNKFSTHDVIAFVKSFSGSSTVRQTLCTEQAQDCEVAAEEQRVGPLDNTDAAEERKGGDVRRGTTGKKKKKKKIGRET